MENLLTKEALTKRMATVANPLGIQSLDELHDLLQIYRELKVPESFFDIAQDDSIEIKGTEYSEHIPIMNIISVAQKLNKLKGCKGFSSLGDGMRNPSQFSATVFEITCAYYMCTRPEVTELIFAPEVIVNNSKKYPEFKCNGAGFELYCECKSMDSINRAKSSRALRLIKQIEKNLKGVLSEKFRVEIAFKSLPSNWNRNYGDQLKGAIMALIKSGFTKNVIELNMDKKHQTWIKLNKISDPPFLKSTLNVANRIPTKSPTLVIGEHSNIKSDIKAQIRDALTQLPADMNSIVFVYSLNEYFAGQAISEFFTDNNIEALSAVGSWTKNLTFHLNPQCKFILKDHLSLS